MNLRSIGLCLVLTSGIAVAQPAAPQPAAPQPAARVPHTVERGGGVGRVLAWSAAITGVLGGLAAGGLYLAAKHDLDDCTQHTVLGLGCADKQKQLDDATGVATIGGAAAGGLIATSILLFILTDASHTEIVYDDVAPEPPGVPYGLYIGTAAVLGGAIAATVIMRGAADDLGDPTRHPDQAQTSSLVSRYHDARYAAGAGYALAAGLGALAAYETIGFMRRESPTKLAIAPMASGAMLAIAGRF